MTPLKQSYFLLCYHCKVKQTPEYNIIYCKCWLLDRNNWSFENHVFEWNDLRSSVDVVLNINKRVKSTKILKCHVYCINETFWSYSSSSQRTMQIEEHTELCMWLQCQYRYHTSSVWSGFCKVVGGFLCCTDLKSSEMKRK